MQYEEVVEEQILKQIRVVQKVIRSGRQPLNNKIREIEVGSLRKILSEQRRYLCRAFCNLRKNGSGTGEDCGDQEHLNHLKHVMPLQDFDFC